MKQSTFVKYICVSVCTVPVKLLMTCGMVWAGCELKKEIPKKGLITNYP